jgi:hypothetical protein
VRAVIFNDAASAGIRPASRACIGSALGIAALRVDYRIGAHRRRRRQLASAS